MTDVNSRNSSAVTRADARHHVLSLGLVLMLLLTLARVDFPWLFPFLRPSGTFHEGINTLDNVRVKSLRCIEFCPSTEPMRQPRINMYSCRDTNKHGSVSTALLRIGVDISLHVAEFGGKE